MTAAFNQRGISRRVLARDAAAKITHQAACTGLAAWWSQLESATNWNGGSREPIDQAVAAIAPLCATCPALTQCAAWARAEGYTGLAAGTLYIDGQPTTRAAIA